MTMNNIFKASILTASICLSSTGTYAHEQMLLLQPTEQINRELFIQDWILLNISQQHQAIGGTYSSDSNFFDRDRLIQSAQQGLLMNDSEIHRLTNLKMQTRAYQNLVSLKINKIKIDKRILEQVIKQSESTRPQAISTTKMLNASLKVKALEQTYEIKNLNYFNKLLNKQPSTTKQLLSIKNAFFQDWIDYKLLNHQLHTIPKPTTDTLTLIKSLKEPSDQVIITAFQKLNPTTQAFKELVQLQITQWQHSDQLYSGLAKAPKTIKEAEQSLKKLSQILQSKKFQDGVDMSQNIERLEKQFDHQVFTALSQYY